jgi:hypothetical protein
MRLLMTSVAALAGILAGAGAASACDWHHQQVMASAASAAPAATEQQQPVAATQVDPWVLAYLDKLAKDSPPAATSQDTQVK